MLFLSAVTSSGLIIFRLCKKQCKNYHNNYDFSMLGVDGTRASTWRACAARLQRRVHKDLLKKDESCVLSGKRFSCEFGCGVFYKLF